MRPLVQQPATGERLVRFVGDRIRFELRDATERDWPPGWRACLRTNLGRAAVLREEILASVRSDRPRTMACWRDIPLAWDGAAWNVTLALTEVGYFRAKAFAIDPHGWQHWPAGPDTGLNVQPAVCRGGNTVYAVFPRLFGPAKAALTGRQPTLETQLRTLDTLGYAVIPPSGRLRDVLAELPHIFDVLGCRILHLLPVNPPPTTYARFGRFGSPYASVDLTAIDPALVEFDRRSTGVDQFRELAYGVHARGGRLFLDIVINHTGWGSTLQENQPHWFPRGPDGSFVSPGAWGVVWEDLVELEHGHPALREYLAEAFLEWCRRGVDGFRCDAGYQVPLPVWQYITARVRQEFPETVFLLEGLGGAWEATEELLTEGGLQWAYSELFQNYGGLQVAGYLDHALRQSQRVGLLIHYSETHDNDRLAARGRGWSLLRNRLCALTAVSGGYGFTSGVEWLAPEKINVHSATGLAWGRADNLVAELARLNALLAEHPCFFDHAELTRLSAPNSPVYALLRRSAEGVDTVLALVNTDADHPQAVALDTQVLAQAGLGPSQLLDLLGQPPPPWESAGSGPGRFQLAAGAAFCLAAEPHPRGLAGEAYRAHHARLALALSALAHYLPAEALGTVDGPRLAEWVDRDLPSFLSALTHLDRDRPPLDLWEALQAAAVHFPCVVTWELADHRRVLPVPPEHWLVVRDPARFRLTLTRPGGEHPLRRESIATRGGQVACLPPAAEFGDAELALERYAEADRRMGARVRFLAPGPRAAKPANAPAGAAGRRPGPNDLVLLTNHRGGMARLGVDLGSIRSKYDCLLAANLHPRVPVDRHVFAKRARIWVNADGFLSPLNAENLASFTPGPPAEWRFLAHAGDGRTVEVHLRAAMLPERNCTALWLARPAGGVPSGAELPAGCDVRLTVRIDLEDRNFHWETRRDGGAEHHFATHCRTLTGQPGFAFTPAADRALRVFAQAGQYHAQPEWSERLAHPVEQSRGLAASGDAYSPGWFEIPLPKGAATTLVVCGDPADPEPEELARALRPSAGAAAKGGDSGGDDAFAAELTRATSAFLARRDEGQTVIAGYPWFLDWGRDTLIAGRGLLAAGQGATVRQLLTLFGGFERAGTLPNALHGTDASNRETSDAPLWYGLLAEEAAATDPARAASVYASVVDAAGRTVADVLRSIGGHYLHGTSNGIRVDPASGLVWSPAHFTWMDTNHPAGTPREGYPVCIQALWIRLLRHLERLGTPPLEPPWGELARRALASLERLFWLEDRGYYADVLLAGRGQPAGDAVVDTALRSNGLWLVSLGLVGGERARRTVAAALRHLVVPGALRSLAPLPVSPPLPIHDRQGRLLNLPTEPYWGRYEGDEDTRRKPAYHNGTAWTWTWPMFCEALVRAWDHAPAAVAAARAYLGGVDRLLDEGCLGHLPEILDGDAPHQQRGCDAQAWSVTEALRVWRWLRHG